MVRANQKLVNHLQLFPTQLMQANGRALIWPSFVRTFSSSTAALFNALTWIAFGGTLHLHYMSTSIFTSIRAKRILAFKNSCVCPVSCFALSNELFLFFFKWANLLGIPPSYPIGAFHPHGGATGTFTMIKGNHVQSLMCYTCQKPIPIQITTCG
jgi:hypothetical protein